MTRAELVSLLNKHPHDAEVCIHDAEKNGLAPVTGIVTGPDPNLAGAYVIELCSDTMGG